MYRMIAIPIQVNRRPGRPCAVRRSRRGITSPTRFGFKVAVWIDELGRHVERLQGCEDRVFVAMLGGGADPAVTAPSVARAGRCCPPRPGGDSGSRAAR